MRLFVTGGTGFIGSHFLRQALAEGHELVALRRSPASVPRVVLESSPRWIDKPLGEVEAAELAGCDAVVHLAAAGVSPQVAAWEEMVETNVVASARLFECAREAQVKRWVVAGTFAEYGRAAERHEFIPEDASLEPTLPYAATKAAFFPIVHALAVTGRAELAYLRIFSAYGAGQHPGNFWPSLRRAALAGKDFPMSPGGQVRDFIPVEEVARTILRAASEFIAPGMPRVRNLGSGQAQTLGEFALRWWNEWEARGSILMGALPYREDEVMRFVPRIRGKEPTPE